MNCSIIIIILWSFFSFTFWSFPVVQAINLSKKNFQLSFSSKWIQYKTNHLLLDLLKYQKQCFLPMANQIERCQEQFTKKWNISSAEHLFSFQNKKSCCSLNQFYFCVYNSFKKNNCNQDALEEWTSLGRQFYVKCFNQLAMDPTCANVQSNQLFFALLLAYVLLHLISYLLIIKLNKYFFHSTDNTAIEANHFKLNLLE